MSTGKITQNNGQLEVPNNPTIPFIEGDGIGPDIWRASQRVFDAAIKKAFKGEKKVNWKEVLAGEKAFNQTGEWLPEETVETFKEYLVGIKGPLTTPIGGGFTSLNVALRQKLDLFVCLRPVTYFEGVPSPVKKPEDVDMVIFRENTEDIYAGVEWNANSPEVRKLIKFLNEEMGVAKIRFPKSSSIGVKPISIEGSERLIKSAIDYALKEEKTSVTFVHKGNIMKFTEGGFKKWGYELAKREYRKEIVTERESWIISNVDNKPTITVSENAKAIEPGYDLMTKSQQEAIKSEVRETLKLLPTHGSRQWENKLLIKDIIADIALQKVLTNARQFSVIATMNLNGDYLSDALAAQVGGIGIAPGANINYNTGHAIFEATHGTAPIYANLDKVNPCSVILSGCMMFKHIGWDSVHDSIIHSIRKTIKQGTVTYDLAFAKSKILKCSEFADELIKNL